MPLNDGFGDELNVAEQLQRFYAASVHEVAKWNRASDDRFDDLVQEGVTAAWKATRIPLREPVVYGAVSARRRIADVALGKSPMLGNETGGPTYDVIRHRSDRREDFDSVMMLEAPDLLSEIEGSYHHGEIMQVLNRMPMEHREYVYLRFWLGLGNAEIADRRGSKTTTEKLLWQRTIRPRLARELAHLR